MNTPVFVEPKDEPYVLLKVVPIRSKDVSNGSLYVLDNSDVQQLVDVSIRQAKEIEMLRGGKIVQMYSKKQHA